MSSEPHTSIEGAADVARRQRQHFETAHEDRRDPWGVLTRWYEIRRRALILASLPGEHYGSVLELGCSTGVLTEQLAARSDRVLGIDFAESAVRAAQDRLHPVPGAEARQGDIRAAIPEGPWDLVVLSEVCYYLTGAELTDLLERLEQQLAPDGTLLACHWRHPEADFLQTGDAVHRILAFETRLDRIVHHEEADFLLDIYAGDSRSVASRTGLR